VTDTTASASAISLQPVPAGLWSGWQEGSELSNWQIQQACMNEKKSLSPAFTHVNQVSAAPAQKHNYESSDLYCCALLQVSAFAELLLTRLRLGEALRDCISDPTAALRFLNPGRLIRVDNAPPDPHRQLPPLGTYAESAAATADADAQQQEAADGAGVSNGVKHKHATGTAAAAAAAAAAADAEEAEPPGLRGSGPDVVAAVDAGSVWGVLVNFQKAGKSKSNSSNAGGEDEDVSGSKGSSSSSARYAIDVLVNVDPATLPRGAAEGATGPSSSSRGVLPRLLPPGAAGGVPVVLTLPLEHLSCFSAVRLRIMKDLRAVEARSTMLAAAAEVIKRHAGADGSSAGSSLPLLDPVQDMKVWLTVTFCTFFGAACCLLIHSLPPCRV
jgi:hypothetical protein